MTERPPMHALVTITMCQDDGELARPVTGVYLGEEPLDIWDEDGQWTMPRFRLPDGTITYGAECYWTYPAMTDEAQRLWDEARNA